MLPQSDHDPHEGTGAALTIERAYATAYELVRNDPNDPDVALGYLGIGILSGDANFGAEPTSLQLGTGVWLRGPGGARRTYLIDEGEDFFSIQVIPPDNPMARRLIGKAKGEFADIPKMGFQESDRWTIEDLANRYEYLHRQILENFESRFPGQNRLSSFTMENGDIQPVLDVVRRRAEHNQGLARSYLEKELPLAFVARMLGTDVSSFAAFVRQMGGDIATCRGSAKERSEAIHQARRGRARGAVLDPYTALVASDMGVLADLKSWFGTLSTPTSTIDHIDRLIDNEREGLGKTQHSISWQDGQYFRHETGDAERIARAERLSTLRAQIVEYMDIQPVLIPDDATADVTRTLRMVGSHFFDAGFLAIDRDAPLMSDDLRYRDLCELMLGTKGTWLQAALQAAAENGVIAPEKYAKAVVGLAARRHSHVALTGPVLFTIAANDDSDLSDLRIALKRLGGPNAEMASHIVVLREFLNLLWANGHDLPLVTRQAATSAAIEAVVAGRQRDALDVLRVALQQVPAIPAAREHRRAWLTGHFIVLERLKTIAAPAPSPGPAPALRPSSKRARRRKRRRGGQ